MVIMWVNIWMDDVLTPRRPNMCAASILFLGKYHFVVLPLPCVWTCFFCPSPLFYTFTFIMKALMTYFPREIHEIFFHSILNSDTRQTKLKQRKVSAIRSNTRQQVAASFSLIFEQCISHHKPK